MEREQKRRKTKAGGGGQDIVVDLLKKEFEQVYIFLLNTNI